MAFVVEEVSDELAAMDPAAVKPFVAISSGGSSTSPRAMCSSASHPGARTGVVHFEMADLAELDSFFMLLPPTVVVDHMGTPDVMKGVDHCYNRRFHWFKEQHPNIWIKEIGPERMSVAGHRYVVPFRRALVERFPERVIGGTDWPHSNMKKEAPETGCWSSTPRRSRPPRPTSRRCWSIVPFRSIGAETSRGAWS